MTEAETLVKLFPSAFDDGATRSWALAAREALIRLHKQNEQMTEALYRAKDEIEGWFGDDPSESLGSVVEVLQVVSIKDTLEQIEKALWR